MSCFFCKSNYHVSHNCDQISSAESRLKMLSSKNCCFNCFTSLSAELVCINCKFLLKCFVCFSKDHSTIYCPDGVKASNIILPNIDEDLLFRFWQLLKKKEKCSLSFSYPNLFEALKLKPLKVKLAEKIYYSTIQDYLDFDLVNADKCDVIRLTRNGAKNLKSEDLPIFHIKNLEIHRAVFSQEITLLLSSKTIRLKCGFIKIHPNLTFCKILEKAPKLEEIDIHLTNIIADNSWPDYILNFNKSDSLRYLHFSIPADLNFSIESLITLLKKTSVKIYAFVTVSYLADVKEGIKTLKNILSKQFIPRHYGDNDTRILFVFRLGPLGSSHYDCYAFTEL